MNTFKIPHNLFIQYHLYSAGSITDDSLKPADYSNEQQRTATLKERDKSKPIKTVIA
ncbi:MULTISPECIES: hypothetical protein [unclassified Gilliamella]|uniref:hypothetical protein n=1 Tax=unclassified Gilliamella TaxID=2685620 RepID=UPI0022698FA5|nr:MULTISPECIES: hypothetical protein [unclassified Gilliamella]MCX8602261.1 hypothetical protein [Gilliamella sp. B3722]MCX8608438.1 hypothetical protein [Gilliamella sp. B3771]MCX8611577.1 hypothetical protein [Gilliamella sp. B3891]MCX8616468.1 hypothetical protein [Gilliamella sp. B3770]MCX8621261.1 hypothetical protein [Gilliamella sp. B3892]